MGVGYSHIYSIPVFPILCQTFLSWVTVGLVNEIIEYDFYFWDSTPHNLNLEKKGNGLRISEVWPSSMRNNILEHIMYRESYLFI